MKARILVIDDEESVRFTFERFFGSKGHTVTTAANCRDAREAIDGGKFDLVFSDLILPDGMGTDLLQQIKQKTPECPVIMMTAYPSEETERESYRMGALDYVLKPIREQKTMELLNLGLSAAINPAKAMRPLGWQSSSTLT